MSQLQYE